MNNFYSEETYLQNKAIFKKYLIISIILLVIGLALVGFSAFLIKYENALIFKIVDSVILAITVISFLYLLIEKVIYSKRRYSFILRLLATASYVGKAKIVKIKRPYFVKKGIYCYEIDALVDDKLSTYYLETIYPFELKEDDEVELTVTNNFITNIKK